MLAFDVHSQGQQSRCICKPFGLIRPPLRLNPPERTAHLITCQASQEKDKTSGQDTQGPRPSVTDPVQTIAWGGRLPSRRRVVTSTLSAIAIVLASNLGGSTSSLLGLLPGNITRKFRLDVLYPRKGYKRCLDLQNGFEFEYPSRWLADQRLLQRYASRLEQRNPLDLPSLQKSKQRNMPEPAAAFGPAGSTGEENLSVIVAPISTGFELRSLGNPEEAAQRFLEKTIAPRGSDLKAILLNASQRQIDSDLYYTMEYTVQRPSFFRHNLSVYAVRNGLLYTLNAQVPNDKWGEIEQQYRHAAESFRVLEVGAGSPSIPGGMRPGIPTGLRGREV
ncbi:hypothetical protein WJX73_010365 [Symbiochloris irregularis]|uniref:PsbP C-terminal domain-containing protein n=1 Tax=Symbiochloris irregularis TaxID=706552 RepID=A0AAW1NTK9_9CHLO